MRVKAIFPPNEHQKPHKKGYGTGNFIGFYKIRRRIGDVFDWPELQDANDLPSWVEPVPEDTPLRNTEPRRSMPIQGY